MVKNNNTEHVGHVQLVNVVKEFAGADKPFRAVDNVNIDIQPGEFLTLLGPSGCGKTTTLRMVAGFETPSSGQILLDGKDMVSLTPDKRPMTMVFQSYALFPHLTVKENIEYGLKIKKMKKPEMEEAVQAVLESMSLTGLQHRAPAQLSGGQQQRVALARAVVMQPKVLLFDEPLSNLDAKLRERMRLELRKMQRRLGITSLYVTHDQAEAMTLSDRVLVMNAGRIEQVATPAEIYSHPATVFVADFIGRANFLPCEVTEVSAAQPYNQAKVNLLGMSGVQIGAQERVESGENNLVLIRPESLQLNDLSEAESEPDIKGSIVRVVASVFYGDHMEYEVESEYGNLTVIESNPNMAEIKQEGEWAKLSFDAHKAWVLPK